MKKKADVPKAFKKFWQVFETFKPPCDWTIRNLSLNHPSCFNGEVKIKKYKYTIEEVEEPPELLQARLEELWINCDNHHHHSALSHAAKKLGYTFKGKFGSARRENK